MQDSMYHIVLRTSALTLALVLLFVSGVVSPVTEQLAMETERYLASAVGMYASVEPNEFNQITAALTARETDLNAREAALKERELSTGLADAATADYTTYILSVILFVLLVLIVLNYILDFVRATRRTGVKVYGQVA